MTRVEFNVLGLPVPQGALVRAPQGHLYHHNRSQLEAWREAIATEARGQQRLADLIDGPVRVGVTFRMPRPKGHFGRQGTVRAAAPGFPTTPPDIDKLVRAVLDALSHVLFLDDRQVVQLDVRKLYTDSPTAIPGATIVVSEVVA